MNAKIFKIVAFSVAGVLLALLIAISAAVGAFSGLLDKFVVGYKGGGAAATAARADGAKLSEQIQAEGTVLVKNEDEQGKAVLPLTTTDVPRVNVFGWASVDWVVSGSGSGQVKGSKTTKLLDDTDNKVPGALTEAGIEYNEELTKMYQDFASHREKSENGGGINDAQSNAAALKNFNYEFSRLYEPSIDDDTYYKTSILENALSYSDTALVVIGRVSGESNDSPKVQYKMTTKNGKIEEDTTRTYLEISTEEEALLEYVGANYKNVIVLINSTNVMELGFLETIEGLDAGLIVATTGSAGAKAIPKLIYSDITDDNGDIVSISPSGKTADTYVYDLSTSSTYIDTGSGNDTTHFYSNTLNNTSGTVSGGIYPTNVWHTNGSKDEAYAGAAYQDYRESVYMGYKWYETADETGFWDSAYARNKWNITNGYDDVVQYPFGYGLSYTEFSWEITYLEQPNGTTLSEDDLIKVIVRVTNTGKVAGQDVVELYYTAPYKDGNDIEKSSVNLIAFGKTQNVLEPGEHEDVILEFTVSEMASYDYDAKKINGGGYVLEKGDYKISLRTDAHNLASKKVSGGVYGNDTLTYTIGSDTHVMKEAENRFTGTDTTDGVAIDGNSDGTAEITYLSRADFTGTFPAEFGENRAMTDSIKKWNIYTSALADEWDTAHDNGSVYFGTSGSMLVYEKYTDEKGIERGRINELGIELGLNYDDERWEDLLDVITKAQMTNLVLHGYTKTAALPSIGKPETLDLDGPNQIGSFTGGITSEATGFSSIVLAQSWNLELAYSMGLAFGTECATYGVTGWYGPGVNVHRSPFGGRNYEYYSEDPIMSGLMCAKVVSAAKNKGVFCYLKHLCLYEGESGRDGMYTWVTEQALREIYLKPFELAVKVGGSSAIMTSYGRIGAVWTGGSEALLTEVVRGEWGFKGAFLTDYSDHHDFMNGDQMIRAGGDLWMDWYDDTSSAAGKFVCSTSSNAFNAQLRTATKNIVYMWLNALATNADYNAKIESGEIDDKIVIPVSPELNFRWYIPVVVVVDVLFAAGAGVLIFFGIKKKDKPAAEAVTEAEVNSDPSSPAEESNEVNNVTEATDVTETPEE